MHYHYATKYHIASFTEETFMMLINCTNTLAQYQTWCNAVQRSSTATRRVHINETVK